MLRILTETINGSDALALPKDLNFDIILRIHVSVMHLWTSYVLLLVNFIAFNLDRNYADAFEEEAKNLETAWTLCIDCMPTRGIFDPRDPMFTPIISIWREVVVFSHHIS